MSGMPAALKARVLADCKTGTDKLTTSHPWQPAAKPAAPSWDPVKAQVREMCAGIEQSKRSLFNGTHRRDLLKVAAELQAKPSSDRQQRYCLTDQAERRVKLITETGYDTAGILVEPPQEEWERPRAQTLYHKLMVRQPGKPSVNDYEGEDLYHLMWMLGAELVDIDEDGRIYLLSDPAEPNLRKYTGFPLPDARASIGRTHIAEVVERDVLEVWQMIVDGHPPMDIPGDYRQEMSTARGLRISGRMITYQCNKLLAARMDAECSCLGRDLVKFAWELPDHGEGCRGRERGYHVEVVRRAIRHLIELGKLVRTDSAHLLRRGHADRRIPAAYEIPADAGWHAYAARCRRPRRKQMPKLYVRLLGDETVPAPPPDAEFLNG